MLLQLLSLTSLAYAAYETNNSIELSHKAERKREKAVERENDAYRKVKRAEKRAEDSFTKLYNIRKAISNSSLKNFYNVFMPISTLSFLQSMNDMSNKKIISIRDSFKEIEGVTTIYAEPMTNKQQMTLLLFGPVGIMYGARKESEKDLAYANKQMRLAGLIEQQSDNQTLVLDTMTQKNEMMWKLLRDLNLLFMRATNECRKTIEKNGIKEENYTDQELDYLRFCIQLADLICKLSNESIVDKNGDFSQKVISYTEQGNKILENVNLQLMNRR